MLRDACCNRKHQDLLTNLLGNYGVQLYCDEIAPRCSGKPVATTGATTGVSEQFGGIGLEYG